MQRAVHRLIEIDLLRSLAIALMAVYHAAYDLDVFYGAPIGALEGGWRLLARITAILFLLLAGVSFSLAEHRMRDAGLPPAAITRRHLARGGGRVFGAALLVTLVTLIVLPDAYVRFGILHCIAVTTILLIALRPFGRHITTVSVLVIAGALLLPAHGSTILMPIGVPPPGFASIDYFPLVPWAGVMILGAGLGMIDAERRRRPRTAVHPLLAALAWPGRRSLLLYLLHQPLILLALRLALGPPATS